MPRKYTGKITTSHVERRQKNGDIYVYEEERQYDREKGYSVIQHSKLIGVKKKGTDQVVPTRARRKFVNVTQEETTPFGELKAVRKHDGMMDIVNHMSKTSGIDEDIRAATDIPTADKIMSLAQYIVCNDSHSLTGIEEWQYTHDLPYKDGINKNIYHTLFKEIGRDETLQQAFFKFRLDREDKVGLFLACDSTLISTWSDNLTDDIARYRKNSEDDEMPKVKYLVLFSLKTNMPVWFTELPGNISDIVTIKNVIDELKALRIKEVTLVTDCGFFSVQNIGEMLGHNYDFITLANLNNWVDVGHYSFFRTIQSAKYTCPFDVDIHGFTTSITKSFEWTRTYGSTSKNIKPGDKVTGLKTVYRHTFCSQERKLAEDNAVKRNLVDINKQLESGNIKLEDMTKATQELVKKCCRIYRDEAGNIVKAHIDGQGFDEYCKYNGIFIIVTNRNMDCFECLKWYRCREHIEDFFRRAKNDGNMRRTGVWTKDILLGRMFVQFVALCLYQHTENEILRVKNSLLEKNDVHSEFRVKKITDDEKKLLNWLDSRSIVRILNWFDAYDRVDISIKLRLKRWSTSNTKRDRMFLEKLGVIPSTS